MHAHPDHLAVRGVQPHVGGIDQDVRPVLRSDAHRIAELSHGLVRPHDQI